MAERNAVPDHLGRVLRADGTPIGTCFQVAPGVLVTAWHVADAAGAQLLVDPLAGGDAVPAHVQAVDEVHDLAVLLRAEPLAGSVPGLLPTMSVDALTSVVLAGVAEFPDERPHRYVTATGSWQGAAMRADGVVLGRVEAKGVLRGMSGGPVRRLADDRVVGVVSARYNSPDGWLRDTLWVARTEDLIPLLPAGVAADTSPPGAPTKYLARIGPAGVAAISPVHAGAERSIGRSPDSDIVVPDEFRAAGREHARFGCDASGCCWIEDLHPNGTYVNDGLVGKGAGRRPLDVGDVVTLAGPRGPGPARCTFVVTDLPERPRAASTDWFVSENATVLALRASSTTGSRRLDDELHAIDRAIRVARYRDQVDLRQASVQSLADLLEAVHRYSPAIVHVNGLGGDADGVALLGERGAPVPPVALAELFRALNDRPGVPPVRCVVLTGCCGPVQAEALSVAVECVVGTPPGIADDAAIGFSAAYYLALASGEPVQRAFELGRAVVAFGAADAAPVLVAQGSVAARLHFTAERQGPR